jgi:hypothetical protein
MKWTHAEYQEIEYYEDNHPELGRVLYRMIVKDSEDGTVVYWEIATDDGNVDWHRIHISTLRTMSEETRMMMREAERPWQM